MFPNYLLASSCYFLDIAPLLTLLEQAMTLRPTRPDMSWLRDALRAPGRSQTALAQFLGLDKTAVTKIIQGKRAVKVEESEAISKYLEETSPQIGSKTSRHEKFAPKNITTTSSYEYDDSAQLRLMNALARGDDWDLINQSFDELFDSLIGLTNFDYSPKNYPFIGKLREVKASPDSIVTLASALAAFDKLPPEFFDVIYTACDKYRELKNRPNLDISDFEAFYRNYQSLSAIDPDADMPRLRASFAFFMKSVAIACIRRFDSSVADDIYSLLSTPTKAR